MAFGSCKDCEAIQRGGKSPRCLVCIYHDASIFNVKIIDKAHVIESIKEFNNISNESHHNKICSFIKTSVFSEVYAKNAERWENNGINLNEHFGYIVQDVDAENERTSHKEMFYFTFPCDFYLRTKYIRVFGTNIETRTIIEKAFPDKDYKQWSFDEWTTPNRYTRRKPCDCYIEWTI